MTLTDAELDRLADKLAPRIAAALSAQRAKARAALEAADASGPGVILKKLIKSVTGQEPEPHCACRARIAQMNRWGWSGCWRNRETIYSWLADEASKRGHKIESPASFFLAAWKELRRDEPR